MMKKINNGFGGVGDLIHRQMKKSMSIVKSTANDELRLSSQAVGQWKKNHEMSTLNVKEKIKQQQAAYDTLLELFDEMGEKTDAFNRALKQWENVGLVEATSAMFDTFLSIPTVFSVKRGMGKRAETEAIMVIMEQLHSTFSIVTKTLEFNVKITNVYYKLYRGENVQ